MPALASPQTTEAAAPMTARVAVHDLPLRPLSSLPKPAGCCEPANAYYCKQRGIFILGTNLTTQCHTFPEAQVAVVFKGANCQN